MNVNDRLIKFYNWYVIQNNLTQKEFSKVVGIGYTQLNLIFTGKNNAGLSIIQKFLDSFPDLNANWLLTGEGEMLKNGEVNGEVIKEKSENTPIYNIENNNKNRLNEPSPTYEKKERLNDKNKIETRPRIPYNAAAGSLSCALSGITADDVEQMPVIAAFPNYHFTIMTRGDSMDDEMHSGDELACLYVNKSSFIQWGKIHVLDTAQGIITKRIFDEDEFILCRSENNELYPDFRIHKSEVFNIGLVIGLIRRY